MTKGDKRKEALDNENTPPDPLKRFLPRVQFDAVFHVGHSKGYRLRAAHNVTVLKAGSTCLIPVEEIDRIVAALPRGVDSDHMIPALAAKRVKREAAKQQASG